MPSILFDFYFLLYKRIILTGDVCNHFIIGSFKGFTFFSGTRTHFKIEFVFVAIPQPRTYAHTFSGSQVGNIGTPSIEPSTVLFFGFELFALLRIGFGIDFHYFTVFSLCIAFERGLWNIGIFTLTGIDPIVGVVEIPFDLFGSISGACLRCAYLTFRVLTKTPVNIAFTTADGAEYRCNY